MAYPWSAQTMDTGSNLDIDTSAEQLTDSDYQCRIGILIRADDENTGNIFVGLSNVTAGDTPWTDGMKLCPGDALFLEINRPNRVYVIADAANQKAYWIAI